ncbi:hypothetical protein [Arthrobacter sp. NPDC058127]
MPVSHGQAIAARQAKQMATDESLAARLIGVDQHSTNLFWPFEDD